jgi:putative glutamine amidotransferase
VGVNQTPVQAQSQTYVTAVIAAGGAPVLLSLGMGIDALMAAFGRIDGLLLAGGEDVAPSEFGQEAHPKLGRVDTERDRTELILARRALADSMPILAICRGIQLLNVAAGGTLIQDIASQVANPINHRCMNTPEERNMVAHEITVVQGSRLALALGGTRIGVNSGHHQAVDRVAQGFRVVANGPDGIIEGIEAERGFSLGVQWHPEQFVGRASWADGLFRALIDASRK